MDETVRAVVRRGQELGSLTWDQITEMVPPDALTADQLDDLLARLAEAGVELVVDEPDPAPAPGPDTLAGLLARVDERGPARRKALLLAAACCRRAWGLLPDPRTRAGVEAAERYADGQITVAQMHDAGGDAYRAWEDTEPRADDTEDDPDMGPHRGSAVFHAANAVVRLTGTGGAWDWAGAAEGVASELRRGVWFAADGDQRAAARDEERAQVRLCWDVFGHRLGDPEVPLDLRWRSADVTALARGIYADRAFARLPLLADALMDAGCDSDDIVAHCRGEGPHVRGCWVVDLILGRQ